MSAALAFKWERHLDPLVMVIDLVFGGLVGNATLIAITGSKLSLQHFPNPVRDTSPTTARDPTARKGRFGTFRRCGGAWQGDVLHDNLRAVF